MATATKPRNRPLLEWNAPAPAGSPLVVDRDAGVIAGVKVLGSRSRNSHGLKEATNGTEYTRRCMEAALPLYEGVDVLVDHDAGPARKGRASADVFGQLRNARLEADGIRADLHYLRSHPLADRVVEDVERGLGVYGLSHDASAGKERFDPATRRLVIESLGAVRSVDLVRKPATNRNLWESHEDHPVKTTLRELLEGLTLTPTRSAWRKRLLEMDDVPAMDDPLPADTPADDPDAALKGGFDAACMACINSADMTADEKIAKLKELLKAHEKLTQKAEPDAPAVAGDDDGGVPDETKTESVKAENEKLRHKIAVRELCETAGVKVDKTLLESLEALPIDQGRKLVEREVERSARLARGGSGSPRSSAPGGGKPAGKKSGKAFVDAITG